MTKLDALRLADVLSADASLRASARADLQANVLDATGPLEAEAACAAAIMASRSIAEATADVGLGRPLAWYASLGHASWYLVPGPEQVVLVVGSTSKNPSATLGKIVASCGARP